MASAGSIIAHQGGWDEMALVAVPVLVFVVLLRYANSSTRTVDDDGPDGPDPL